jgi:hypothetical protein
MACLNSRRADEHRGLSPASSQVMRGRGWLSRPETAGTNLRSASVSRSFIYSVDVHGEHAVERPNQKAAVTGGHEYERVRSDRAM